MIKSLINKICLLLVKLNQIYLRKGYLGKKYEEYKHEDYIT